MPEFFIGAKQGEFGLDNFADLCARFPQYVERAVASSLRSEGYRLRQIIKASIVLGGPAGHRWPELHPHTLSIMKSRQRHSRWAAQRAKGKTVRASTLAKYRGHTEFLPAGVKPLRKMAGAVRYVYHKSVHEVIIGFLGAKTRELATKHAEGFTMTVDRRMGKQLAAHGFPVKTGTVLKVPPRPVVEPVFRAEESRIYKNLRENVVYNIHRYLTGRAKDWDKTQP